MTTKRARMNAKKFTIASIAVVIFIFIFELLFHGMYLKSTYEQTAGLWRSEAEMKDYVLWLTLGQIIISIGFVALFTKAFKRGGIVEGVVYGLLLAIIFVGNLLIWYAVAPYHTNLLINWIVGTVIELVLAGVIVAFIYQSRTTEAA